MRHLCTRFLCCFVLCCTTLGSAQVAITTYQHDNYRSGVNQNETTLTPSNVNATQFGRKAVFPVQGFVYAQPLYVPNVTIGGTSHNVVFIATEHDQVYAFDVNSGQQLWHNNLLVNVTSLLVTSTVSSNDVGCSDMVPEIGITGTPVIDTASNTMYFVAKTKQYNAVTHITTFFQTLHALDIRTGIDRSIPRPISGTARGTGSGSINGVLTFDPRIEGQRAALLLLNGQIIVSWASHCDLGTYHGWMMSFSEGNMAPTGIIVDTPNGYEGGYWGGGSGAAADSSSSIYASTGNGTFDVTGGGVDYGDSVLRLTWNATSGFTINDYFTPWDQQTLDNNDTDVGSGGVVLLPDQPGTTYPHLLIQVGKEGTIDLVNRDGMGHFHSGNDSQIVQTLQYAIGGIWGGMAFWNNTAYFNGSYDRLKAYSFDPHAQKLSSGPTSVSPEVFGYPGATPAISANGTSNGIAWIIQADDWGGGTATLRAYDATNLGTELYNSKQNASRDNPGLALKFTTPTVADGHVFVGAENQVSMFGLF